ncbi:hypothetical protein [Afipia sp. P52-10]|uniref:hypothetical protein n=1 Tax=Afipia sp. P52-10 TaxID=1429916 RepID=UPI001267B73F|nr:hypothetical protein [Afipia sp. P52-10]
MMISNRVIGGVAVALLLFGAWVYLVRPDHKYRLTINVETPFGVKSGSGVVSVHLSKDPPLLPHIGSIGAKGDAIFVNLGEGRNLFMIMAAGKKGENVDAIAYLAEKVLAATGHKVSFQDVYKFAGRTLPVGSDHIPTLVSFVDLKDVATARVVRPDDLQSVFGAGYRLSEVTLTVVSVGLWPFDWGGVLGEPVTRGIENKIPEIIARLRERSQVMQIHRPNDPYIAELGQFIRG